MIDPREVEALVALCDDGGAIFCGPAVYDALAVGLADAGLDIARCGIRRNAALAPGVLLGVAAEFLHLMQAHETMAVTTTDSTTCPQSKVLEPTDARA